MNYVGNIYIKFHEVLKKNDGLSVGEKLFSIEKELGIEYIYANDQAIYEAMESFLKHPVDTSDDEKMTEEEFEAWVENKFQEQ